MNTEPFATPIADIETFASSFPSAPQYFASENIREGFAIARHEGQIVEVNESHPFPLAEILGIAIAPIARLEAINDRCAVAGEFRLKAKQYELLKKIESVIPGATGDIGRGIF